MEEREALKRQIELLQNLINKHKSVHGDTPFDRVEQRQPEAPPSARGGHSTFVSHHHSSRGSAYAPQSHGSWRKTYSLRNKNPQSSVGPPAASASSTVHQTSSLSRSHSASLPSHSRGEQSSHIKTATISSGISHQSREEQLDGVKQISGAGPEKETTDALRQTGAAVAQREKQSRERLQSAESSCAVLPRKKASGPSDVPSSVTATSLQSSPQVQTKPALSSRTSTSTESEPSINTAAAAALVTAKTGPPLPSVSKVSKLSKPSVSATSLTSQVHAGASFLKKSKFTWVKSQNTGGAEAKRVSPISSPQGKAVAVSPVLVSKAEAASCSPSFNAALKRSSAKKLARKLSPVAVAPKTSKYKWVSSSAGAQAKLSRKSLSPKVLTLSQRAVEKGEATKKLRAASAPSARVKKGTVGSPSNSTVSSRYRWKAGGQSTSAPLTGGATVARRKSAFHWTSDKSSKGVRGGLPVSPSVTQRASFTPSSSPAGFKLRSRMKIIRKSAISGAGSERGGGPSAAKYSQRGRTQSSTRSPTGVRRTPSRELVSFGRHKLRRLSPGSSRTSPASPSSFFSSSSSSPSPSSYHRSAASQQTYRTRFKMVTRSSTAHALSYNPALSWRAKRIQTARSFLQSRLRAPHDRHPPATQRWRGSGMCWIRGSLYRVSANKLSRTVASSMSINRTGRPFSGAQGSPTAPALSRPYSTRHLASRAVQRSLAIIRHARQKKQPKQYCMYYNRFGKCNRGDGCPYIHDPDKVAVCTRFLRGTCKQADGTCPFSHKVAKEKMPVCSYFLKGICNNSDCPYSHVYVSRKAEVCEDFVKGYCPEGEKCKKKHTLVCPDFSKAGSCPRGARCKLQHRQRAKRSAGSASAPAAKRARSKEPPRRPRLSVVIPPAAQGTPTKGPQALPSFISLSSSPEEADAPDARPAETTQVKERKLQIKPRL